MQRRAAPPGLIRPLSPRRDGNCGLVTSVLSASGGASPERSGGLDASLRSFVQCSGPPVASTRLASPGNAYTGMLRRSEAARRAAESKAELYEAEIARLRAELDGQRSRAAAAENRALWSGRGFPHLQHLFAAKPGRNERLRAAVSLTAPVAFRAPPAWLKCAQELTYRPGLSMLVGIPPVFHPPPLISPHPASCISSPRSMRVKRTIANRRTRFAPHLQCNERGLMQPEDGSEISPVSSLMSPGGSGRKQGSRRGSKASSPSKKYRTPLSGRDISRSLSHDNSPSSTSGRERGMKRRHTTQEPGSLRRSSKNGPGSPRGGPQSPRVQGARAERMQWKQGSLLGAGGFGTVHLGLNSQTGELMAVKQIRFDNKDSKLKQQLAQLQTELTLLKTLTHHNVVRYLATERDGNTVLIFMEYVSGGSVADLLTQFGCLALDTVRKYTQQILAAVEYIHSKDVIHRDIKAANVLLTVDGECKLSDFGASAMSGDAGKGGPATSPRAMSPRIRRQSMQGTPSHMAPEVITQQEYDSAVDIWSLGCTVLEMLTGSAPFGHLDLAPLDLMRFVAGIGVSEEERVAPLPLPVEEVPEIVQAFLQRCLVRDPLQRAEAAELLGDEWLFEESDSDFFGSDTDTDSETESVVWPSALAQRTETLESHQNAIPILAMMLRMTERGLRRVYFHRWVAVYNEHMKRFKDALKQSDRIVSIVSLFTDSGTLRLYFGRMLRWFQRRQRHREQEAYRVSLLNRACALQARPGGVDDLLAASNLGRSGVDCPPPGISPRNPQPRTSPRKNNLHFATPTPTISVHSASDGALKRKSPRVLAPKATPSEPDMEIIQWIPTGPLSDSILPPAAGDDDDKEAGSSRGDLQTPVGCLTGSYRPPGAGWKFPMMASNVSTFSAHTGVSTEHFPSGGFPSGSPGEEGIMAGSQSPSDKPRQRVRILGLDPGASFDNSMSINIIESAGNSPRGTPPPRGETLESSGLDQNQSFAGGDSTRVRPNVSFNVAPPGILTTASTNVSFSVTPPDVLPAASSVQLSTSSPSVSFSAEAGAAAPVRRRLSMLPASAAAAGALRRHSFAPSSLSATRRMSIRPPPAQGALMPNRGRSFLHMRLASAIADEGKGSGSANGGTPRMGSAEFGISADHTAWDDDQPHRRLPSDRRSSGGTLPRCQTFPRRIPSSGDHRRIPSSEGPLSASRNNSRQISNLTQHTERVSGEYEPLESMNSRNPSREKTNTTTLQTDVWTVSDLPMVPEHDQADGQDNDKE
eukprot:Hpha_TRINITY_DN7229_c0_g1::TRINITY_DN7229_c0_g1_i1::g.102214::m.102214